ncbi:hypothetical protein JCM11641_002705 [Rhodosporidiobolus odoratus]
MVQLFTTSFPFNFPWPAQVYAVMNKYPNPLAPHVVSVDVVDRRFLEDGTLRSERILGIQQDSPRWVRRLLGAPDITYAREISFLVPSSLPPPHPPLPPETPSTSLAEPPKLLMASTNLSLSSLLQCRESISYLPHPWPHLPKPTRRQLAPGLAGGSLRGVEGEGEGAGADEEEEGLGSYPQAKDTDHPLSHPTMPSTTLFSQSALIFSCGLMAAFPYPPTQCTSSPSSTPPESLPEASTVFQRAGGKKVEEYSKGRFEENAQGGRAALEWISGKLWRAIEEEDGGE